MTPFQKLQRSFWLGFPLLIALFDVLNLYRPTDNVLHILYYLLVLGFCVWFWSDYRSARKRTRHVGAQISHYNRQVLGMLIVLTLIILILLLDPGLLARVLGT